MMPTCMHMAVMPGIPQKLTPVVTALPGWRPEVHRQPLTCSGAMQVKPEDARYTVNVPEGIAALNLDIMRLCAQMVARNGTKFLKSTQPASDWCSQLGSMQSLGLPIRQRLLL